MPIDRFYYSDDLVSSHSITLDDREFHHLVHVTRSKEHQQVEVINGEGKLAQAVIQSINKKNVQLKILSIREEPPPSFSIFLALAIPRMNRLDTIIEKCTELGVTEFWFFPGMLSEKKLLTSQQLSRLQSIAIAATKQCGRLYLPKLTLKLPLDKWEKVSHPAFYGNVNPDAPALLNELQKKQHEDVLFFVGPESGFHKQEEKLLQSLGAQGVSLHQNTLRVDTAAITAMAICYHSCI